MRGQEASERGRETEFRDLAEHAPVTVFILQDGKVVYTNPFCRQRSGFSAEDLAKMDATEAIFPEWREEVRGAINDILNRETESYSTEMRVFLKDGSDMWVEISLSRIPWQARDAVLAVAPDISARKHAENLSKELWSRLSDAEEHERDQLAAELHDSAGQMLTAGLFKLDALGEHVDDPRGRQILDQAFAIFREVSRGVRNLTFEMSPPILIEQGFAAALEWLGQGFAERHGLRFKFQCSTDLQDLGQATAISLFRSVRETFVNIAKHAEATRVHVTAASDAESRYIRIRDDGVGFDPQQTTDGRLGWGLFSIRERMKNLGGEVRMESTAGGGTTVTLWFAPPAPPASGPCNKGGRRETEPFP